MNKQKIPAVDVLYALGTILVILGHSHSSNGATFEGTPLVSLIQVIYSFHMPLFFFVAGFLLRNSSAIQRMGYGKWAVEKLLKLLTPYVVLSAAAFFPKYYLENRSFSGLDGQLLLELLFKPRATVWGHFWFLPVLCTLYLLFGLWKRLISKKAEPVALPVLTVLLAVFYILPVSTDWLGFNDIKIGAFYFALGMLWHLYFEKGKCLGKLPAAAVAGFGIAAAMILLWHFSGNIYIAPIIACLMIYACWQLAMLLGVRKWSSWLSLHNFTFYIYSWLFQSVVMMVCDKLLMPWYVTTPVMFISGMIFPAVMILAYEKFPKIHCKFFDLILGVK